MIRFLLPILTKVESGCPTYVYVRCGERAPVPVTGGAAACSSCRLETSQRGEVEVAASLEKKVDAQFGAISEHSSKALKRWLPHG